MKKKLAFCAYILFIVSIMGCGRRNSVPPLVEPGWNADHSVYTSSHGVKFTEDEYMILAAIHSEVTENVELQIDDATLFDYALLGKLDTTDVSDNPPLKSSIKEILLSHSGIKWVEAGTDERYELDVTIDEDKATVVINDIKDRLLVCDFEIDIETIEESSRYNYLTVKLPDTNENVYFYCRRSDYIQVRINNGYGSSDYQERIYTFVPEGSIVSNPPGVLLENRSVYSGNALFEFNTAIHLNEDSGIVHGNLTYAKYSNTDTFQITFSGMVESGILEYSDYECNHLSRKSPEEEYIIQPDSVSGLTGKVYFYNTFLLLEDAYSGNDYAFAYDKMR